MPPDGSVACHVKRVRNSIRKRNIIEVDRDVQQLLVAERSMIFANTKSEVFEELVASYEENLEQSDQRWKKYASLSTTPEEKALIPKYEKAREEWKVISRRIVEGRKADTRQGRREALDLTLGQAKVKFEEMRSYLDQLTEINLGLAKEASQNAAKTYNLAIITLFSILGAGLLATIIPALMISRGITAPLSKAVAGLKDIAEGEGDLTKRLEIKNKDEVGDLARWFNTFLDKLRDMIRNINKDAETLNSSSEGISNLSSQMSGAIGNMSSKSDSVAAAAEEMRTNMTSVAGAVEQATANINIVASSAEEMTSSVNEIAQNSEKARDITNDAVIKADSAFKRVEQLGKAALDIDKVTEAITEISEQTNLLALNATIEAARAGEMGKGFNVVANEIKELARQTAEATQEIREKINSIQNSTNNPVSEIEEISGVVKDVNEIVSAIAAAVEEQSVTTKKIAQNVAQANHGINEVNENVSQSSKVSREIAHEISEVNQAAGETANSSSQVNVSAGELKRLAGKLSEMVGRFKL
jgi:methyl-accepting chemotaxis protein